MLSLIYLTTGSCQSITIKYWLCNNIQQQRPTKGSTENEPCEEHYISRSQDRSVGLDHRRERERDEWNGADAINAVLICILSPLKQINAVSLPSLQHVRPTKCSINFYHVMQLHLTSNQLSYQYDALSDDKCGRGEGHHTHASQPRSQDPTALQHSTLQFRFKNISAASFKFSSS